MIIIVWFYEDICKILFEVGKLMVMFLFVIVNVLILKYVLIEE